MREKKNEISFYFSYCRWHESYGDRHQAPNRSRLKKPSARRDRTVFTAFMPSSSVVAEFGSSPDGFRRVLAVSQVLANQVRHFHWNRIIIQESTIDIGGIKRL